eukprot:475394-Pleurochrysis_carterae.AAC.1
MASPHYIELLPLPAARLVRALAGFGVWRGAWRPAGVRWNHEVETRVGVFPLIVTTQLPLATSTALTKVKLTPMPSTSMT